MRVALGAELVNGRGLHSFALELNSSNSRTHSGLSWVTRWTEALKLSRNRSECKALVNGDTIRGQNQISHPSADPKLFSNSFKKGKKGLGGAGGKAALAMSSDFWFQVLESGQVPDVPTHEFWGGLQKSSGGHERSGPVHYAEIRHPPRILITYT